MTRRRTVVVGLSTIALGVLTAVGVGAQAGYGDAEPERAEAPRGASVVLVKHHADWCGKCVALEPVLDELKDAMAEDPVLFLTLDKTDERTARQSEFLASAVDLNAGWADHAATTGFMILHDAETGRILETFRAGQTAIEIAQTIRSFY